MKKNLLWILSFILVLGLGVASFGQTDVSDSQAKAIKNLRKGLEKNSRYQFQHISIFFEPVRFKTCEVSFKFVSGKSIGGGTSTSSSMLSSPLDSYQRTRRQPERIQTGRNGAETTVHGQNDSVLNKINEEANTRTSVLNTLNLADLIVDSIKITSLSSGIFMMVDFEATGDSNEPKKEVFPVIGMKQAKELKGLFAAAFEECK